MQYSCKMLETPNVSGLAELEQEVNRLVNQEIERMKLNEWTLASTQLLKRSEAIYDIACHFIKQ